MSKIINRKPLTAAIGAAIITTLSGAPIANADSNPFAASQLTSGYMVADSTMEKGKDREGNCGAMGKAKGEGKCGEGKCGEEMKSKMKSKMEGKCGEGKCGEGKCGGDMKSKMKSNMEGKCGEGKCGDDMKSKMKSKMEGKCGEGKCGDDMKSKMKDAE